MEHVHTQKETFNEYHLEGLFALLCRYTYDKQVKTGIVYLPITVWTWVQFPHISHTYLCILRTFISHVYCYVLGLYIYTHY